VPGITYYYMNHPEAFQREFTNADLVAIIISLVAVAAVVGITLAIIHYFADI